MSMRKMIKVFMPLIICGFLFTFTVVSSFANASAMEAMSLREGAEAARCSECPEDLFGDTGVFKQITNVVLYIVGVIAVIMLIIGGVKYVISGGDAKKVTDAKNTVLYAIIGLIIAFLAFAIVNFVITSLPSSSANNGA